MLIFNKKNYLQSRKGAFTLVEVLITLSIVGVIATLVFPVLIQGFGSANKLMLKKAYYNMSEAINEIINNDAVYPSEQTLIFTSPDGERQRGLNYTTAVVNGTSNKFCYYLVNSFRKVRDFTCPLVTATSGTGNFTTTDGIYYGLFIPVSDSTNNSAITTMSIQANTAAYQFPINASMYTTKLLVDVNGVGNAPDCTLDTEGNTYSFNYDIKCKNPDRFIFGVRYDGKLQVGCSTNPTCTVPTDANAIKILSDPRDPLKN